MVHSVVRRAWWRVVAVLSAVLVGAGATVAVLGAPASAATTLPITGITGVAKIATVAGPLGIAASGGDIYVTHPYTGATQYVTVLVGGVVPTPATPTRHVPIPNFKTSTFCETNACPGYFTVEPYVAVAPGTATSGFTGGGVYITQGPNVYEMPAGGGTLTLFTTVPGLFPGVPGSPEYSTGITFDTVGTYTHDMILTSPNGTAWNVTATGTATELGALTHAMTSNLSTVIEGPAVAPMSFTPFGGDLLVGAENKHEVLALTPTPTAPTGYVFTHVVTIPVGTHASLESVDGIEVIPASPCAITVTVSGTKSPYAWFTSLWDGNRATNKIGALPASAFSGLGGDVVVQNENYGAVIQSTPTANPVTPSVTLLRPGTTHVTSTVFVQNLTQQEGATFEQCPGGTTGAYTIGYWRNKIGNAELSSATPSLWPVRLGTQTQSRSAPTFFGITVTGNTGLTQSNAFLDGTACGQKKGSLTPTTFFPCATPGLATGLHERTFEDLVAQTLALSYNVEASATLAGTVFSGCNATYITGTALTGLTTLGASSNVTAILTVANHLIATSITGGTTTQTEAGAMTALLGECINTV